MERISERERQYVSEVLDSQFRTSAGSSMTKRLEETFARVFGVKYAISFINGTATMHAALAAAGIGPGDEVIVPPLTMASTAFAVLHANAVPVFADINPRTWTIDPRSIEERITPYTKAVIPVAIYGLSPDMDAIMSLAKRHGLFVLEDDAQCFLGYYRGRVVGSIGDAASFSFQSSKHMTSGEGGMITTDDDELADKIRRFNSLGYTGLGAGAGKGKITKDVIQDPHYARHSSLGFNYRLPELCSAVALGQVERLPEIVQRRIEVAQLYAQAIEGYSWLTPQFVPEDYQNSYWTFAAKLEEDVDFSWYDFRKKYLELGGHGFYAAWRLNYLEPVFQNQVFYPKGCPVTCPYYQGRLQKYGPGLCPTAEALQPRLMQFKTNYLNESLAYTQAEILRKTLAYFGA